MTATAAREATTKSGWLQRMAQTGQLPHIFASENKHPKGFERFMRDVKKEKDNKKLKKEDKDEKKQGKKPEEETTEESSEEEPKPHKRDSKDKESGSSGTDAIKNMLFDNNNNPNW